MGGSLCLPPDPAPVEGSGGVDEPPVRLVAKGFREAADAGAGESGTGVAPKWMKKKVPVGIAPT